MMDVHLKFFGIFKQFLIFLNYYKQLYKRINLLKNPFYHNPTLWRSIKTERRDKIGT